MSIVRTKPKVKYLYCVVVILDACCGRF